MRPNLLFLNIVKTSFAFDKVSMLKGSASKSIKVHHKYGTHIFKKLLARLTGLFKSQNPLGVGVR